MNWRILLLVTILSVFVAGVAQPQSRQRTAVKKRQLQNRLGEIRNRKEALRQQLRKTSAAAREVKEDIWVVDARLEKIENQLGQTNSRLNENRSQQMTLAQRLEQVDARLKQVREQVRRRMRYMYLRPNDSAISVVVGSRSMSQLLSRQQIAESIVRRDRKMFDEYRNLLEEVSQKKLEQDRLVREISDLRARQYTHQRELESNKQEKRSLLDGLRGKQAELQRAIAQFERDEAAIAAEIAAFARRRPSNSLPPMKGRFLRPAKGPITSTFGMRYHPILHIRRMHKGVDIGARSGSPIYAAADGEVVIAKYSSSYGNYVMIAHGGGFTTVYAHASRLMVRAGQQVRRGQQIAAVGSTGLAKGPHLHWEVYRNGVAVNPLGY